MTPHALFPALLIPLILFGLYRRFRRNFGQQPIQRTRMMVRIGIMSVLLLLFAFSSLHQTQLLQGALAGVVLGAALAVWSLRLTRFEITPDGKEFYTPNSYFGMALTALLVGRLVYRFIVVAPAVQSAAEYSPQTNPFAAVSSSPLTIGVITMLIGYYLVYYVGILREGKKHGVV
jgi:Protein of unknown function (DUF1453)